MLTLQDYVAAFELAKSKASPADDLAGNPLRWGVVRGIVAVIEMEREACAKIAETYKHKAEMRAGMHKRERNEPARDAALDKFEAAQEIARKIRARGAQT